jgi:methyl-accepting chemotaxis protein
MTDEAMDQNNFLLPFEQKITNMLSLALVTLWLLGLGLAMVQQSWFEALLLGRLIAGGPLLLNYLSPGTRLIRMVYGAAFMAMTALHVYQMHGPDRNVSRILCLARRRVCFCGL